jgi:hypothetical protein
MQRAVSQRKQSARRVWPGAFRGTGSVRLSRAGGRVRRPGSRRGQLCASRGYGPSASVSWAGNARRSGSSVLSVSGAASRMCPSCGPRPANVHARVQQPNPPFERTPFRTPARGGLAHVPPRAGVLQGAAQLDVRLSSYWRRAVFAVSRRRALSFVQQDYSDADRALEHATMVPPRSTHRAEARNLALRCRRTSSCALELGRALPSRRTGMPRVAHWATFHWHDGGQLALRGRDGVAIRA